jgi:hypothetical protein
MRASLSSLERGAIVGTDKSGSDCAVTWQRIFREAKLYWPKGTAKKIAGITGAGVRTTYRWLAMAHGRKGAKPHGAAVVAVVLALRAEYVARGRIFEQLELSLD